MIIAVCDPKGIAIEAIKTILYHDKGLSDRISRMDERQLGGKLPRSNN